MTGHMMIGYVDVPRRSTAAAWLARPVAGLFLALLICLAMIGMTMGQAQARGAPESFADLAEKLLPMVVNISTSQKIKKRERPSGPDFQLPPGSPFEEFFERFRGRPESPMRRAQSLGSGFIIDGDKGLVVTNNHVIDGAEKIKVILHDDTELDATVLGTDPKTDIALLSVEADGPLAQVEFGNSDKTRIGDWVIAIGNPLGLGGTVTTGIVSARGRDINSGPYDDFIQTDAPINRGNSGGPLFDMEGRVIGINTAIISQTGGSIGIGFAIPSRQAENVIAQLQEFGTTRRGWLGVNIQRVTPDIAESLGMDAPVGALVSSVYDSSPAAKAGFESGDVIVRFDGKDVETSRNLPRIVAETAVGKNAEVEVWRGDRKITLTVTLGELEKVDLAALGTGGGGDEDSGNGTVSVDSLGLGLVAITGDMVAELDLDPDAKGVLVTEVDEDSNAAEKRLRPGDVIREVNQRQVETPGDVASAVEDALEDDKRSVLLLVERNAESRFVALKITEG